MKSTKYQVFLSSTYSDLVEERESIIKAILELYHIPIGMEMFSAEDEAQWEIIRRTIEVSDYYILVLGLRYGSKASDGISFTQKEYEYALDKKIPILAFVMKDTVPLPKGKRDDDLSEINNFRELVLTNSRMAQFWETKDQLIKNVSISLMKQIMQKPGVGWVRGDKAGVEEALSKELTTLSRENRELREKILQLELKMSLRIPVIELVIEPPVIDANFYSHEKAEMPNTLNFSDVEAHLLEYISEQDIDTYNINIPSQSELEEYNDECEKFYRISNYSSPLVINVSNRGSVKANNLFIDIEFPEGLLIYENRKKHAEPQTPIPFNPIKRAQAEYNKKIKEQTSALSRLNSSFGLRNELGLYNSSILPQLHLENFDAYNQPLRTKLDGRKITVKIDSLLHTRHRIFNNEYMISPLTTGKHTIEIRVICEEYEGIETQLIEFDI
ncbi:MAG: DUF4062 domain-containing protein [Gallionella sp.]